MTELNREIVKQIRNLDCDDNMKSFLIEALNYEIELHEGDSGESKQAIGKEYKKFISTFSK